MSTNPMFQDRVPEAAAQQIAVILAEAMEAHFATLEMMEMRRSTPARDIVRQRAIIAKLMPHCIDLKVPAYGLGYVDGCPRFAAALELERFRFSDTGRSEGAC